MSAIKKDPKIMAEEKFQAILERVNITCQRVNGGKKIKAG